MEPYQQIFKRKSFHLFRNTEPISQAKLNRLRDYISQVTPLVPEIKTAIQIVPEAETSCRRGAQYCILFYSEQKGNYLQNIGYIGEQIDLYLASENIGALWYGTGKPKGQRNGLEFVIMIAIAGVQATKFRKDMSKAKRKPLEEIWRGDSLGVGEITRFAPSACNTQPWFTENCDGKLLVSRYKKPGKRGIIPVHRLTYYNRIDMGIYLLFLEVCLKHAGYGFARKVLPDYIERDDELTPAAQYQLTMQKGFDAVDENNDSTFISG